MSQGTMLSNSDRCVFYIATGDKFIAEAARSAKSVKVHNNLDTVLFTDTPDFRDRTDIFNVQVSVPERRGELFFLYHTRIMAIAHQCLKESGYSQAVFMDTDTYCCENFDDVFDSLSKFDIMGVHAPGRQTTSSVVSAPPSFPEINIGFNPMVVGDTMSKILLKMVELYENNKEEYRNNDQGSFRDSLWLSEFARLGVLPPEYNLRFNFPCFASGAVRVLHGHHDNIEKIAEIANSEKGMRAWNTGIVV